MIVQETSTILQEKSMRMARLVLLLPLGCGLPAVAQAAEPTTVEYALSVAGLPIGSATMVLTPNGSATSVAIWGKAGGPFNLGRLNATAMISTGSVSAQSVSGSGKDTSSARLLSKGQPGDSSFTYDGTSRRGPGRIAMTVAGNRVSALDVIIPDSTEAVRVPVTDAHKAGIVDPLSVLGQLVVPGGTLQPGGLCGKSHAVFTGQARLSVVGTPGENRAAQGLPPGYAAITCTVTVTPVAGHRTDKGNGAKANTAVLVFARSADAQRTVLWSLSVPGTFGTFALTAQAIR